MRETALWATPIGMPDSDEVLILGATTDTRRVLDARAWASAHGFDRLREQVIDGTLPDFVGAMKFPPKKISWTQQPRAKGGPSPPGDVPAIGAGKTESASESEAARSTK